MSKWSDVKIYDLSIPIGVNCPPWPTYEPVQMKFFKRLSSNGANGQILTHSNHVGTHLDGPLHFDTSGRTVDQLELTKLVHGEEEAEKAREASKALFSGQGSLDNMPNHQLAEADFNEEGMIDILAVLQKSGLAPSRAEARRNVEQGGVSINGDQVKDIKKTFTKDDFGGDGMIVKRGKKNFMKVTL